MPTATDVRHTEAVRLRRNGLSFSQIARELGYGPYPSAARYAYLAGIRAEGQTQASNTRQFGVEIEFYNVRPIVLIEALAEIGIDCEYEGYNHNTRPHWKIVRDGSVTSRNTGEGSGLEMVSPILRGSEGLAELQKVMDTMARVGAKVNSSCGLHVHIDQAGLTGAQRRNFFLTYATNNGIMDRLVSRSRRAWNNSYCYSYRSTVIADYAYCAETGDNSYPESNPRYHTINITCFGKYGTFEVRQHQGTLNARKAIAWVKLIQAMCDFAKNLGEDAENTTVPTFTSVENMLDTFNLDNDTKTFWLRREAKLNPSSLAA